MYPIDDIEAAANKAAIAMPLAVVVKGLEIYDAVKTTDKYNMEIKKNLRIEFIPNTTGLGVRVKMEY